MNNCLDWDMGKNTTCQSIDLGVQGTPVPEASGGLKNTVFSHFEIIHLYIMFN